MLERGRRRPGDVIIRFERPIKLRRILGIPSLYSAAYGNVGSSIYYALGVVAMSALGLTPPVLFFSGIIFLFTGLVYAEGATMLPEAGGTGAFARRAFNDMASFIASWVLMLDYLVTIAISAFSAANYLAHFFPQIGMWPLNSFTGIGIVGLLVGINILGIKESARLNILLVIFGIITQLSIAVIGVLFIINIPRLIENVHWGVAPTMQQLLFGISIAMVGYTGIETVANLGGEARQPAKYIPRTVYLIFITVIILYTLLSMTALSAYPVYEFHNHWVTELTEKFLNDPIMGIAAATPDFIRPYLSFWVAVLAVVILVIATNAGIIGASRLAYFMGIRRQLPSFIGSVSTHARVPFNALIIFSGLASLLILIGQVTILADLYAFGAMLAYTIAHVSIIALRIKEPQMIRPFKVPFNIKIKNRKIPLPALIGGLVTATTWVIVIWTHPFGRVVGFLWMLLGIVLYLVYRKFTHQSIFKAVDLPTHYKMYRT